MFHSSVSLPEGHPFISSSNIPFSCHEWSTNKKSANSQFSIFHRLTQLSSIFHSFSMWYNDVWIKSSLSSTFHSFNHQGSTEMDAQNHDGPRCGLQKSFLCRKREPVEPWLKSMEIPWNPPFWTWISIWDKQTWMFFILKIWDIPCEDGKSMEIPTPNGGERSWEKMWKRWGNPL